MQSLVSLSYLPDAMLCLSFSFSAAVAAADSSSSSSSLHCIQLQLLWRLLFVLHFLLCSLSRSLYTHIFSHCAYFVHFLSSSFSSFTLFWCTHVALVAFLFVSLAFHLPRCCCCWFCCCCCVHFLCYFFSFTLLCRFVRSFCCVEFQPAKRAWNVCACVCV